MVVKEKGRRGQSRAGLCGEIRKGYVRRMRKELGNEMGRGGMQELPLREERYGSERVWECGGTEEQGAEERGTEDQGTQDHHARGPRASCSWAARHSGRGRNGVITSD